MKPIMKSMYGSKVLLKGWCPDCKGYYFLIKGELQCCGKRLAQIPGNEITKRESETPNKRGFSAKDKKEALEEQDYCCIYCGTDLMGYEWNPQKEIYVKVKIHYDHFIPWSYSGDNQKSNVLASCSTCNLLKSDLYFRTIEEAKEYIMSRRQARNTM